MRAAIQLAGLALIVTSIAGGCSNGDSPAGADGNDAGRSTGGAAAKGGASGEGPGDVAGSGDGGDSNSSTGEAGLGGSTGEPGGASGSAGRVTSGGAPNPGGGAGGGAGKSGAGGTGGNTAICGDGKVQAGEECDDGNSWPGDGCYLCKDTRRCDTCWNPLESTSGGAGQGGGSAGQGGPETWVHKVGGCTVFQGTTPEDYAEGYGLCFTTDNPLTGGRIVENGPGKGKHQAELCTALYKCAADNGCTNGAGTLDIWSRCYCGYTDGSFQACATPQGPCKAEIEAATESPSPAATFVQFQNHFGDPNSSIGAAGLLLQCQGDCSSQCGTECASTRAAQPKLPLKVPGCNSGRCYADSECGGNGKCNGASAGTCDTQCTSNSQCGSGTCGVVGKCAAQACTADTDCGTGKCVNRQCNTVECATDSDCGTRGSCTRLCTAAPCLRDADCGTGRCSASIAGTCVGGDCSDSSQCGSIGTCISGKRCRSGACTTDSMCGKNGHCNAGVCDRGDCSLDSECGSNGTCGRYCTPNDCAQGYSCDETNTACLAVYCPGDGSRPEAGGAGGGAAAGGAGRAGQ